MVKMRTVLTNTPFRLWARCSTRKTMMDPTHPDTEELPIDPVIIDPAVIDPLVIDPMVIGPSIQASTLLVPRQPTAIHLPHVPTTCSPYWFSRTPPYSALCSSRSASTISLPCIPTTHSPHPHFFCTISFLSIAASCHLDSHTFASRSKVARLVYEKLRASICTGSWPDIHKNHQAVCGVGGMQRLRHQRYPYGI